MLGFTACALGAAQGREGDPAMAAEAATARMIAFGKANAACRMWTDWQQLCSNTGPGGSAQCKTDPGVAAAPSEPFCVAQKMPPGSVFSGQDDSVAQRQSRNRFCDERADDDPASARGLEPRCTRYQLRRPFDGRRAEAVAHPLCVKWRDVTPDTAVVQGPDQCIEWAAPLPCAQLIGNAYRHPVPDGLVLTSVRDVRGQAAWGIYCI